LNSVVEHDPFALPDAFPKPALVGAEATPDNDGSAQAVAAANAKALAEAIAQLQLQLAELKQRGVHIVVREGKQYVAMIGDRTLHVGDDINGFTVIAIEPDGVRVERNVQ
jgi:hypothetical protein